MTPEDRPKFLEIVVGFAELRGKQLSAPALELFWNAMQGWSIEDFTAGANQLMRTCEFFPTPKNFEDLRKASSMTPGEAWGLVRDAARNGHPCPTDPKIAAAVRALGGIRAIGMTATDQMHFLERRFAEHYESIIDVEITREALPGIAKRIDKPGPKHIGELL